MYDMLAQQYGKHMLINLLVGKKISCKDLITLRVRGEVK